MSSIYHSIDSEVIIGQLIKRDIEVVGKIGHELGWYNILQESK